RGFLSRRALCASIARLGWGRGFGDQPTAGCKTAPLGRPAKFGRLKPFDALLVGNRLQRKYRALRIDAPDNPTEVGQLDRSLNDAPAENLHEFRSRRDVGNVEIVEPKGNWHDRQFVKYAADNAAAG